MLKKQQETNMVEGVIWKQLLLFFFPLLSGLLFQQLYNMADVVIVGRFAGKEAMAAVSGCGGVVLSTLFRFVDATSEGTSIVVAQHYGAGDVLHVKRGVHTGAAMALCLGILLTIGGVFLAPPLLTLTGVPESTLAMSLAYIRIYLLGTLPSALFAVLSGVMRAVGNSKFPFYVALLSSTLNVVLDVLFTAVFHWGVVGVAIATVTAQTCSATILLCHILTTKRVYRLTLSSIRFHKEELLGIARIGVPSSICGMVYSVVGLTVQTSVNAFGVSAIAAWGVAQKINEIVKASVKAFQLAIVTFVGQNYGARNLTRVKKGIRTGILLAEVLTVFMSAVVVVFAPQWMSLFGSDPAVIQTGITILYLFNILYPAYTIGEILFGSLTGMGNAFVPTLFTLLGIGIVRTSWALIATSLHATLPVVLLCYPVSWITNAIVFRVYYGWFMKRLEKQKGELPC